MRVSVYALLAAVTLGTCSSSLAARVGPSLPAPTPGPASAPQRRALFDTGAVNVLILGMFNVFARFFYAEALAGFTQLLNAIIG